MRHPRRGTGRRNILNLTSGAFGVPPLNSTYGHSGWMKCVIRLFFLFKKKRLNLSSGMKWGSHGPCWPQVPGTALTVKYCEFTADSLDVSSLYPICPRYPKRQGDYLDLPVLPCSPWPGYMTI